MAPAEQPQLMMRTELVAAQRRIRWFRGDEKNSHRFTRDRTQR